MPYFEVRYRAEGLCLSGRWMDYMHSGFVSEDTTYDKIKTYMDDYAKTFDVVHNRISNIRIREITEKERDAILNSDLCFWSKQLNKMTNQAIERFEQNC